VFPDLLRPLAAPAAVVFCAAAGFAQSDIGSWKGELRSDSPRLFGGYTVELFDQRHMRADSVNVGLDGRFEFQHVPEGQYELQISDGAGRVVYDDWVRASSGTRSLEVRIPNESINRPPAGGVSMKQLLHPPQPKAIGHARAAQKFSDAGEYAKAAGELEAALRISPGYAEARTNLGAQYLRLGRYAEALEQLQRAVEIQPSLPALTNLGYAQLMLNRPAESAATARAALRLDADNAAAHYLLGMSLVATGSSTEANPHLEKAAETMPTARVNLQRLRAQ